MRTNHRLGSLSPSGEHRTCEIIRRTGTGWVIPSVTDPLTWIPGISGVATTSRVTSTTQRFVTASYASRVIAHERNVSRGLSRTPARGEILTGPLILARYDRSDRHTVNYRTRDGVEYFDDVSVIDYAATGYRHTYGGVGINDHTDGVIEIASASEYLTRADTLARRAAGYPVFTHEPDVRWSWDPDVGVGWVKSEGRVVADVARCGDCGRAWDDAVVTSVTPSPSARCPFEYDHGTPVAGWYNHGPIGVEQTGLAS